MRKPYSQDRAHRDAEVAAASEGRAVAVPMSGLVVCDALAVAVALDRSGVVTAEQRIHVGVECAGTLTRGMTVCDWGCYDGEESQRPPCVDWVLQCNGQRYIELMDAMLSADEADEVAVGVRSRM